MQFSLPFPSALIVVGEVGGEKGKKKGKKKIILPFLEPRNQMELQSLTRLRAELCFSTHILYLCFYPGIPTVKN